MVRLVALVLAALVLCPVVAAGGEGVVAVVGGEAKCYRDGEAVSPAFLDGDGNWLCFKDKTLASGFPLRTKRGNMVHYRDSKTGKPIGWIRIENDSGPKQ